MKRGRKRRVEGEELERNIARKKGAVTVQGFKTSIHGHRAVLFE